MKLKHYYLLPVLMVLLAGWGRLAGADGLLPPQQVIANTSTQLQAKLQDRAFIKDFPKVTEYVRGLIDPHTDFDRISALVLGRAWRTASADERERFKREFETLLVRTYSRAFVEFTEWTIRFLPLEAGKDAGRVIVRTLVLQPGKEPVSVDYRMALGDGEWEVYDIMIEGVSLVTNYRTTFANEIQAKGSLNAVIMDLAKRNAQALTETPPVKRS